MTEASLHPAHLIDSQGSLTPNALIPFCAYQTFLLGEARPDLPFTACDKFQPTVLEGQLCYSIDLSKMDTNNTKAGLKNGLLFTVDSGKSNTELKTQTEQEGRVNTLNLDPSHADGSSARIYVNTLARFSDFRAGSYALAPVKMMTGTEKFMDLADGTKKCQIATFEECNVQGYIEAVQEKCGCVPWVLGHSLSVEVRLEPEGTI